MNQAQIKALLSSLNSQPSGYRTGWVLGHCPLYWRHGGWDEHPSFAIRVSTPKKKSIGKCLSCGWGGDLTDLLYTMKGHLQHQPNELVDLPTAFKIVNQDAEEFIDGLPIPDYEDKEAVEEHVFPETWLKTFAPIHKFPEALAYCYKREVTPPMLDALDVRFDPIQRRICFPVRDVQGRLMGMQGRAIDPDNALRYFQYGYNGDRNAHVWMGEHTADFDSPLILTEGPFDLASLARVYPNVVASFTTGLSQRKLSRIGDAAELITFYDYGKGGDAARKIIRQKYGGRIPITDVVPEEHEGDAGDMSVQSIALALQGMVPLPSDLIYV